MGLVPIENVYYLLCYAWGFAGMDSGAETQATQADRVEALLAHLLVTGMTRLFKRGLDRSYVTHSDEYSVPRGKIDVGRTVRRQLDRLGRAHCDVDELSVDVAHNRILKATLRDLASCDLGNAKLGDRVRQAVRELRDVGNITVDERAFSKVVLARGAVQYRFLLEVCRLFYSHLLPTPATGRHRFVDFRADNVTMGHVFQRFLFQFMKREQTTFAVRGGEQVKWDLGSTSLGADAFLPVMSTDITLRSERRKIIVEAKFTGSILSSRLGGRPKLESSHMYQLLSYVEHEAARSCDAVEGVLLYAGIGERLHLDYQLRGHPIRVRSIALDQPWPSIHAELAAMVETL